MSNFSPDTGGQRWSLVKVHLFSPASGREGLCRQMLLACVGSTHSVPATLGLSRSRVCAFPVYTAQAPGSSIGSGPCVACGSSFWVLHKSADSVGLRFVPSLPEQLRQTGALWAPSPRCMRLLPSAGPASVSWHASRVPAPCVCSVAATLPADVDHPESQEVFG